MPLPTIETPTYELKLPSNGKKIKYRPFLVKEEKILILALESQSQEEITNSVTDVLKKCILTRGIKVDDLPTFDIEYIFLNIRAKSIGEDITMTITCPDDGETQVPVVIDLDAIKVQKDPEHKLDIKLDDTLTMRMKYPSLGEFVKNNFDVDNIGVSESFEMITACIDQVYNEEESWTSADCTKKELTEFIEQLSSKQFKEVEKFFETMPKLSHKVKVVNPNTKVENEIVLEGLASFFE